MKLVLALCLLIGTVFASPFIRIPYGYYDTDTQIVQNGPYLYGIKRSPQIISYSIQYNRPTFEELDEPEQQESDDNQYYYGHGLFGQDDSSSSEEQQRFVPHLKLGVGVESSEKIQETMTKKSKSKTTKKPSKFDKYKTSTEVPVDPITLINQIKDEYILKLQQLSDEINDKITALTTKAQTEYEEFYSANPTGDASVLSTKYQQKYVDLQNKYDNKTETLLTKYQSKIDALKTPDMTDKQFNLLDLSTFDKIQSTTSSSSIVSENFGNLEFERSDDDDTFQTIDTYQTPFAHSLTFEHPALRLGAVAAPASTIETTTKSPTVADAYWKSFGAKIKETFNKTKTITTDTTPVDATVIADETIVTPVSTTPLPATFYKTFGKTIGKSFKDATAKIKAVVKTTTVAPSSDALPVDDNVVTAEPTIDVDPAFWDDFGKQIEDVFKAKAVLDALKVTTTAAPLTGDIIDPSVVNQQIINLDYQPSDVPVELGNAVTRKLKLGVGAVDDTTIPVVTPLPTVPGIYWKTFGDKIKESFNKSKTVTTDSTVSTDGVTPIAPTLPPTFWMSFGKSIATALNNAKFKLISATKPSTPGPLITDPTLATPVAPTVPIDDTFWDSFSKELDAAILAKAMLTTTATPLADNTLLNQQTTDDLQQLDEDNYSDSLLSKPKLFLAVGDDSTADSPVATPPPPGAFWKNYGGQMAGYFINAKGQLIPSLMVPPFAPMSPYAPVATVAPVSPLVPVAPITTPTSPGLYWKSYGDSLSGHFLNAKGQILDTVSKIKPTFVPYIMPPFFGQTPYSTLNDDSQLVENVDPTQTIQQTYTNDDDYSPVFNKKNKLQLSAGAATDDDIDANPAIYWQNYGKDIRDNFVDAKEKIKNDANISKFEQPIFTDDISDSTSIPEKQVNFWTRFRQRIQDNLSKAKARVSEFTG